MVALTMSAERYREIREKVVKQRLAAKVKEAVLQPGAMTFSSVDDFLTFLDSVTEAADDPPGRSDNP
jgi:hypothetical protein